MNQPVPTRRLSNVQSLLLQLFERDLPEAELIDMRRLLTRHFAQKAEEETERILSERNKSAHDVEKESVAMNENRTAYVRQLRSS